MDKQQFSEKIETVASILGLTWCPKKDWSDNTGELKGLGEVDIWVRNGGYQEAEKIMFSSVYPRDNKGQERSNSGQGVTIRVSETKAAEQIARDIQRRFLPEYLKNLIIVQGWIADLNQSYSQKAANLKQIADHFGLEIRENNREGVIYYSAPGIYSIEAYNATLVRMEKVDCTPEQAITIIELLKEGLGRKET
ncbi:MAG: hypothetical protein AAB694_00585 [Patescibacteria group bacterium]|mgnify:CR=1 FL=1